MFLQVRSGAERSHCHCRVIKLLLEIPHNNYKSLVEYVFLDEEMTYSATLRTIGLKGRLQDMRLANSLLFFIYHTSFKTTYLTLPVSIFSSLRLSCLFPSHLFYFFIDIYVLCLLPTHFIHVFLFSFISSGNNILQSL